MYQSPKKGPGRSTIMLSNHIGPMDFDKKGKYPVAIINIQT